MSLEGFREAHERMRLASNEVNSKAKLILRRALPHIEQLQQENSHFSPRLMGFMCSQAPNNTLSEAERELLGSILQYLEEVGLIWFVWAMAIKDGTLPDDLSAETEKYHESIDRLRDMSAALEEILERVGDS